MIGIFIAGCFITAIVATACGLVIYGIRADQRDLEERRSRAGIVSGTNLRASESTPEQERAPGDA